MKRPARWNRDARSVAAVALSGLLTDHEPSSVEPLTSPDQSKRFLGGFLSFFVLLVLGLPDFVVALTLTWDQNSEEDLARYRVYVGTVSQQYDVETDVGNVTTYQVPDLQPNTTYFFAVTALDFSGNQSGFSNEISVFTVAVPDVVGLEQSAAATALTNAGLMMGDVIMAASATVPAGVVLNQMPAAGEIVAQNSAVDPVVSSGSSSSGNSGGGGGCFIASAAYGSSLAGEVQVLRRFRDRYLLGHPPGRLFVLLYYHISPPLAHAIEGCETLRTVTRGTLWPVVWWADLALVSPGMAFGMGAVGFLAAPFVAFILVRGRRRKASNAILIGVLFCAVQALAEPASAPSAVGRTDESVGEVELATAKPHALIQYGPEKIRTLQAVGDLLFHPKDPTRFVEILEIGPTVVVVHDGATGRKRSLRVGDVIPGVPDLTLAGTVLLNGLSYRFKVVDRITPPEVVVLSFEGSRALLEKQVLRKTLPSSAPQASQQTGPSKPASSLDFDPQLFANVRLDELNANTYLLDANELKPLIEHVRQAVAPLEPMITPALSVLNGKPVDLTSPLADATLSRSGFTVTNLKVAHFFGLQVGDTITTLNGHSVNSPMNAWWTFQEVFVRNPTLTELRVDLIREGKHATKTFQIR